MNYLFLDPNNGHLNTYIPFTSNKLLTQEQATEFMNRHGAIVRKLGCGLEGLIDVANDNGFELSIFKCPCCYQEGRYEKEILPYFKDWSIIKGISGNY